MAPRQQATSGGMSAALAVLLVVLLLSVYIIGYLCLGELEIGAASGRRYRIYSVQWQRRIFPPLAKVESWLTGTETVAVSRLGSIEIMPTIPVVGDD